MALTRAALTWFTNLPRGAITSFAELINRFKNQFASSRRLEKQSSDLYRIVKDDKEFTRDYLRRFNEEKAGIPHCDTHTAIEAFRKGLSPTEELYRELTKYPCKTFEDVQAKTMAQVRMEEDKKSLKAVPEYCNTPSHIGYLRMLGVVYK